MPENEALHAISSRRSIRAYKTDPIPQEFLSAILEAGQTAPYVVPGSRHFSVLRDRSLIARLSEAAKTEGMKLGEFQRGLFSAPGFDGTYGAPVVVIVSENESSVQYEAVCAASVQNMLIAEQSLGIASCWAYFPIFAFHNGGAEAWCRELRVPEGYRPCASVLLGYGAESAAEAEERYRNSVDYV